MKQLTLIVATLLTTWVVGQEVKTSNERVSFSHGTFDAIVVTIPYANKDVIEKELKSEMKDWGGKYNSSKDEYSAKQAKIKDMGDKYFDGYAKIIQSGTDIKVAFAVDLGGAYLNSGEHRDQHKIIENRVKKFGQTASKESVNGMIELETKSLKKLNGEKEDLQKSIEDSKKDIESYKKKITEAEQKIKDDEAATQKKEGEIVAQAKKLEEVQELLKKIK
ncbi:Chromosome partition protein Smc [compost metagenome]